MMVCGCLIFMGFNSHAGFWRKVNRLPVPKRTNSQASNVSMISDEVYDEDEEGEEELEEHTDSN
jgi:hypothetical protein